MKVKVRKCAVSDSLESKVTLDDAPLKRAIDEAFIAINAIDEAFIAKNIGTDDCEERFADKNTLFDFRSVVMKMKSEDMSIDLNKLIFVDPVDFLTPSANKLCLKFINAICTFRYGKIDSNKIDECHKRIVSTIQNAYDSDNNVLTTIFGYIKITDTQDIQYPNNKINILANVIITLILTLGGDFDFDIVETTTEPELFDLCTCQSL